MTLRAWAHETGTLESLNFATRDDGCVGIEWATDRAKDRIIIPVADFLKFRDALNKLQVGLDFTQVTDA